MKKTKNRLVWTLSLIILAIILPINIMSIKGDRSEALQRYTYARDSIGSAYKYLAKAYEGGLDVYGNYAALNEALVKLSSSEAAYNNGEYELAYNLADEVYRVSLVQVSELSALSGSRSIIAQYADSDVALLLIKIVILSVFAYFAWIRIEKYYITKIMDMKPEVI